MPRAVCVRHRHDATGLRRFTTAEQVIDEAPVCGAHIDAKQFTVEVAFAENDL